MPTNKIILKIMLNGKTILHLNMQNYLIWFYKMIWMQKKRHWNHHLWKFFVPINFVFDGIILVLNKHVSIWTLKFYFVKVWIEFKLANSMVVNMGFNVGFKKKFVHYIKYWGCQKLLMELVEVRGWKKNKNKN